MFCMKCGFKLDDGSLFCPECGTKVGTCGTATNAAEPNVVVKTKKECIYERICEVLMAVYSLSSRFRSIGELENYEEGADGMVYCEVVVSTRDALGKTNNIRYGAVIEEVEADGNVIFKRMGPQLLTPISTAKMVKKLCGFKEK